MIIFFKIWKCALIDKLLWFSLHLKIHLHDILLLVLLGHFAYG